MSGRSVPYNEYQDTGLDWLGKVPHHWELRRLGGFFKERREKVSDKDFTALSVTMQGIVPQLEDAAKTKDGDNRKLVRLGDFVINSRSDRKGSSGVSPLDGSVSLIAIVLEPIGMVPAYVHHLLRSEAFQEEFYRFGKGIVADLWSTNYSAMKNITIPVMPIDEQKQIASFLDYETAKIDALIEKQQQLIALLGEKRQAVISHAVTKGLNPDAPMRDSGVEWLGEVPEHWRVVKLKHLVTLPIIDGPHESPTKYDDGIPFISAEAIGGGFIDFEKKWGYISEEDHERYKKRYVSTKGDILMVKLGATTGVVAIVDTDIEFNVWVPLAVIRCNTLADSHFVLNVLRSRNLLNAYEVNWTYGTQQTLGLRTIENLHIPLPPPQEQKAIASELGARLPRLELLSGKAVDAIEVMQERRTALISAAVTGKIDVRGWKRPSAGLKDGTEIEVA